MMWARKILGFLILPLVVLGATGTVVCWCDHCEDDHGSVAEDARCRGCRDEVALEAKDAECDCFEIGAIRTAPPDEIARLLTDGAGSMPIDLVASPPADGSVRLRAEASRPPPFDPVPVARHLSTTRLRI